MSLLSDVTPTVAEFLEWRGLSSVDELDAPEKAVMAHLKQSTALFLLASGLTKPVDPESPIGVIVHAGIMDMTWYIGTSMENRDAMFSPFSSERIGSYSYSKAANAVRAGGETGVPFFDYALMYFANIANDEAGGGIFSSSEHVFTQPFAPRQDLPPIAYPE